MTPALPSVLATGADSPATVRALYVLSLFAHRLRRLWLTARPEGVPAPSRSLALTGKRLLDEIALASVAAFADLPSDEDRARVNQEVHAALEVFEREGWLDRPESYHLAPPALESPAIRSAGFPGFRYEHLSFESGYQPPAAVPGRERWLGYAPNRMAHAWMLRHGGEPRPWLLCLHPYQTGTAFLTLQSFRAQWLGERFGLNILCPVLPLHGPRKVGPKSGDGLLTGDTLNTLHGMAQAVWDLRRLLSWMRAQGDRRIGVFGLSLGGYLTALLAALDGDLACVIAGVPAADFVALEQWHAPPFARRIAARAGTDWEAARKLLSVVSPLALAPLVPRERRFMFAGLGDQLAPPALVHPLWRQWREPRILWFDGGHISSRWEASVSALVSEALITTGLAAPTDLSPALADSEAQ